MSNAERVLNFEDVKQLLKKDGNFVQDTRFERAPDPSFKPWGKQNFRVIDEYVPEPPAPAAPIEEPVVAETVEEVVAQDAGGEGAALGVLLGLGQPFRQAAHHGARRIGCAVNSHPRNRTAPAQAAVTVRRITCPCGECDS